MMKVLVGALVGIYACVAVLLVSLTREKMYDLCYASYVKEEYRQGCTVLFGIRGRPLQK